MLLLKNHLSNIINNKGGNTNEIIEFSENEIGELRNMFLRMNEIAVVSLIF